MQKNYGRKLSSLSEFYRILYLWLRTGKYLFRAQKSGILSTRFIERIMLAVTEVNQCPLCSYAHTKMALEAGMSSAEIKSLLTHHLDSVPDDETTAVTVCPALRRQPLKSLPKSMETCSGHLRRRKSKGNFGRRSDDYVRKHRWDRVEFGQRTPPRKTGSEKQRPL